MTGVDLTGLEWSATKPQLRIKVRGGPRVDGSRIGSGTFRLLRTGVPEADIPALYGSHAPCAAHEATSAPCPTT